MHFDGRNVCSALFFFRLQFEEFKKLKGWVRAVIQDVECVGLAVLRPGLATCNSIAQMIHNGNSK